jgi:hypothetical protein
MKCIYTRRREVGTLRRYQCTSCHARISTREVLLSDEMAGTHKVPAGASVVQAAIREALQRIEAAANKLKEVHDRSQLG